MEERFRRADDMTWLQVELSSIGPSQRGRIRGEIELFRNLLARVG